MNLIKEEFIGNGAHWNVKRVFYTEKGERKSIIHKEPINKNNIENNIINYKLVFSSGLPTLSVFSKQKNCNTEFIEAEDLNPENCNGLYVSPNTVRNSESCASIIARLLNPNSQNKSIDIECEEFNIPELIRNPKQISDKCDELRERRILKGAEKNVYENKIQNISNFKDFIIQSKIDMKNASNNHIELFSDAFFFRVAESNKKIDYKIADFDCIISHKEGNTDINKLFKGNKDYFETSLNEYIEFFIEESQREKYRSIAKNVW